MAYKTILFEKQGDIGLLTLNRPERLNAMSRELVAELTDLFDKLAEDFKTRIIILRGAGKAFSAGTDLDGMIEAQKDYDPAGRGEVQFWYQYMSRTFSNVVLKMRKIPQPIIAAVRGPATGGGFSLTLASDVRIAGESARFNAA